MAHVTFYVAKTFILLHLFPKELHNSHIHETLSLDVGLDRERWLVCAIVLVPQSHTHIHFVVYNLPVRPFVVTVTSDTLHGMRVRQESPKKLFVIKIVQQLKIKQKFICHLGRKN